MPLNWFECKKCEKVYRSKKDTPECCGEVSEKLLIAPTVTMYEPRDKEKGKSQIKDQQKILTERARSHSRDNNLTDLIEKNPMEDAIKNGWVGSDGRKRKKIEDK